MDSWRGRFMVWGLRNDGTTGVRGVLYRIPRGPITRGILRFRLPYRELHIMKVTYDPMRYNLHLYSDYKIELFNGRNHVFRGRIIMMCV